MTQFRKFANPGPLGLSAFALTTFVLSLHNADIGQKAGAPTSVIIGLAFFYGGLSQFMAGMWEFASDNTFGATAFTSFGGFWMSYGVIITPFFGVSSALNAAGPDVKANALGIFLLGWVIMTFILFLATLRTNLGLCVLFAMVDVTLLLLCIGDWTMNHQVSKAGGYFGLLTSLIAWYIAASDLIGHHNSFFILPNPSLAPRPIVTTIEDAKLDDY
ncbi:GPR1/FUN34/yaaH family-domain-containing protein [Kickxella alabastrina]|uniref:GPR1/FUN34/yaaH family-domain-containing protein n=1 Tax=Kickxella alabastrina TaxID=61397 RepID=UPI00221F8C30|nr:GPR1/FUN34/yaaH family-domain-containing protein [Kickxella alabastrina]KAI7828277.1 GPR1/FUN34/yaaH family-domain-containing protein [Kickxella alabastrina]KAJ1934195.1 hypothetical protein GGF37_006458 [Kickxella alabastrina]